MSQEVKQPLLFQPPPDDEVEEARVRVEDSPEKFVHRFKGDRRGLTDWSWTINVRGDHFTLAMCREIDGKLVCASGISMNARQFAALVDAVKAVLAARRSSQSSRTEPGPASPTGSDK